ncbi:MAG: response regulator transcription factor [Betaproteobacteria bacterium]|nr:response regulator transcription factor [Betaproteobacteria bacterium]
MKVLIADDHPVVRHGLKQILAAESNMTVVGEATNGIEALELARKLDWDVAILDYSMPGRNGLDVLNEMKREFPQRPVLILSMHPEELHARRVLKAGAAGYMNKDSAGEELAAAIRKVVNGGKYVSAKLAEKLAVELAPDSQKPPHETLSDREYRVMWLLASGKPINRIAKEMFLSPSTISTYRIRILRKLGLATNAELVHYTIKHQLIE